MIIITKSIMCAYKSLLLEYGLCLGSIGLLCFHMIVLMPPRDPRIVQYDNFQDFVLTLNNCSSTIGRSISAQSQEPICPIDEERLVKFSSDRIKHILNFRHIEKGGRFEPIGCRPLQKIAIIVPYRNREEQLERFTSYMHQFLPNQLIDYTIFVVEQDKLKPFNRAKLFNIGYLESIKLQPDICCFIFHDVDLLPMDQKNLYMCSSKPRHMSSQISIFRFNLLYQQTFGGVVAISKSQYLDIGGFANRFYGWGGEDDDMFRRVIKNNLSICRAPPKISMFNVMWHGKAKPNSSRWFHLQHAPEDDHLSNTYYEILKISSEPLYTLISVII